MNRTKGVSLAKGPVGIIGIVLLAGGILGLLFGSTSFTAEPPDGAVTGGTWFGIEGNGWTWVLFAGAGILLLLSAPMHWGAKTMALIVGLAMGAAAVLSLIDADGGEVLGIFASNDATTLVFAVAAAACLIVALLPRVGRRRVQDDVASRDRTGRFDREAGVAEPVGRRRM